MDKAYQNMTAQHKPTPNRKPGRPVAEPTKPVMLRLTKTQNDKYLELGGARWVKRLIDEALAQTPGNPPG